MTKKKEKQKEKSESNQKVNSESIDQKEGEMKTKQETEIDESKTVDDQKIELLEEKEGAGLQLEYFSKEDLIKQMIVLEEKLKAKDEKIKELQGWKDKYMRLQAEFENTQKRWDKNRQYLKSQYTAAVLKNFLPLYDSFKKAIETSPEKEQLTQFYNQFMSVLKFEGAEPMETKKRDPYDYTYHEALTSVEQEDIEENRILEVIQEGWKFGKEVLRYAKVVISKKPKLPEPEPEVEAEKEAEVKEPTERKEPEKIKEASSQTEKEEPEKSEEVSSQAEKENHSNSNENGYIS